MPVVSKTPLLLGSIVVLALFGSCMSNDDTESTDPTAATTTTATTSAAPTTTAPYTSVAVPAAPASAPVPVGEPVTVTEVIDGDTFKTSDGRTIRVLGIDSCEAGTVGGDTAKSDAELHLSTTYGGPVTLTSQAGVDTDRYGRHLRYVQFGTDRQDFGEEMVGWDHTGVYQGANDASPDYVARLYAKDLEYALNPPSGRECGGSSVPTSSNSDVDVYVSDDEDNYNMPDGALTGGYCARKWWC